MKEQNIMNEFIYGNVRVQILSDKIIRVEEKNNASFLDNNTFFIPDRETVKEEVTVKESVKNGFHVLSFLKYKIYIPVKNPRLSSISLKKNNKTIYHCRLIRNSGELPKINMTPIVFPIMDNPRIQIPEEGYHVDSEEEECRYIIEKEAKDLYLILCERNPYLLRKVYVSLTGKAPLQRLSCLGSWNSKYYAYTQEEALQVIQDYKSHDVPLDNLVIDTDWRKRSEGTGYDINTELFPDMKKFFSDAHRENVSIMFNDHPEPMKDAQNVLSSKEIIFREEKLTSLLKSGLDYWWYDRNWSVSLKSPDQMIHPETWGQYLFTDIQKNYYDSLVLDKTKSRRVGIMSNVDNIANGYYVSICNSATHRYPFQWTGDVASEKTDLIENICNVLKTGENCIPYVHPDCGGHTGNPDKETFIHWMQIGCMQPLFRPHCTNTVERTREPWNYDEETLSIVREAIKRRYRLLPMIYRDSYLSYLEGRPICRSMDYEYPSDIEAKRYYSQYMFGDILVAYPKYEEAHSIGLEELSSKFYPGKLKATIYNGTHLEGKPILEREYDDISFVLLDEPLMKGLPIHDFSIRYEGKLKMDKTEDLFVSADDGVRIYIDEKEVFDWWSYHFASVRKVAAIEKGIHSLRIEYFQAGGGAELKLYHYPNDRLKNGTVYLPKGDKWLNPYDGKIYKGGETIISNPSLNEMSLFIKLGSLLFLAEDENNTNKQYWKKMTMDYYPSYTKHTEGFLYEDDRETLAYQLGEFRRMDYEAFYEKENNCFRVILHKTDGIYGGPFYSETKTFHFKFHQLVYKDVNSITVNGEEVSFYQAKRNMKSPILTNTDSSLDSDTIVFSFEHNMKENTTILIQLG